jgi:hypothetical protein
MGGPGSGRKKTGYSIQGQSIKNNKIKNFGSYKTEKAATKAVGSGVLGFKNFKIKKY